MPLLNMPLETMWSEVQEVRERVRTLLADLPEDVLAATVMTASELIENAIKYGESVPAAPRAVVTLSNKGGVIRIVVKNGVASEDVGKDLRAHVERLASATDKMALYVGRLRELMTANGLGGSKLGLYRIGYEGGFDLHCDYENRVVTMTATRNLSSSAA